MCVFSTIYDDHGIKYINLLYTYFFVEHLTAKKIRSIVIVVNVRLRYYAL